MEKELKDKWIEALRSGKYRQGREYLRRSYVYVDSPQPDEFCCLGVLCNIYNPDQWESDYESNVDTEGRVWLAYDGQAGCLKDPRHYGLTNTTHDTLVTMNDTGRTFEEIAKYIERYVK